MIPLKGERHVIEARNPVSAAPRPLPTLSSSIDTTAQHIDCAVEIEGRLRVVGDRLMGPRPEQEGVGPSGGPAAQIPPLLDTLDHRLSVLTTMLARIAEQLGRIEIAVG
jgi:hypothetical protein